MYILQIYDVRNNRSTKHCEVDFSVLYMCTTKYGHPVLPVATASPFQFIFGAILSFLCYITLAAVIELK